MTPARALITWLLLLALAFANGALRQLLLLPWLGDLRAHQLSCATGAAILGLGAWRVARRWPFASTGQAWGVGAVWLALTVAFELGFGRLRGASWDKLLGDYAVWNGRLWPLVLAWVLFLPLLIRRLDPAPGPGRD